jgi:hypothetical protein
MLIREAGTRVRNRLTRTLFEAEKITDSRRKAGSG